MHGERARLYYQESISGLTTAASLHDVEGGHDPPHHVVDCGGLHVIVEHSLGRFLQGEVGGVSCQRRKTDGPRVSCLGIARTTTDRLDTCTVVDESTELNLDLLKSFAAKVSSEDYTTMPRTELH